MRSLEDELRSALRREEPPAGFAGRVLARVHEREGRHAVSLSAPRRLWNLRPLRWAVAAAVLCMVVFAFVGHRRAQEGKTARSQTILALRIASKQFNGTLREVAETNSIEEPASAGRSSGQREPVL